MSARRPKAPALKWALAGAIWALVASLGSLVVRRWSRSREPVSTAVAFNASAEIVEHPHQSEGDPLRAPLVSPPSTSAIVFTGQPVQERIQGLLDLVEGCNFQLGADVQRELARAVGLLVDVQALSDPSIQGELVAASETAIRALVAQPAKVELARRVLERVEEEIIAARKQASFIVLGLLITVALIIGGIVIVRFVDPTDFFYWLDKTLSPPGPWLITTGLAGALGSIVSLMLRVNVFDRVRGMKPRVLILTGVFKPIVGAVFAMFLYAALRSPLIPFDQRAANGYFYLAISFVAGFSERLVPDVAQNIASSYRSRVSGSKQLRSETS